MTRIWYRADAYPHDCACFPEELLPDVQRVVQGWRVEGRTFSWGASPEMLAPDGPIPVAVGRTDTWKFDLGGMCFGDEPVETIAWNGLTISAFSDFLASIHDRLKKLERCDHVFSRFEIVTWPGMHLLVLPEDYPRLVATVEAALPAAAARAEAFWAKRGAAKARRAP